MILAYMVKKLPTHATMRKMTHIGLDSIGVVIFCIGSVWTPKQVFYLFYAPLKIVLTSVRNSILPSFAPKLIDAFSCHGRTKRSPPAFVMFEQWIFRIMGIHDRWKKNHTRELFFHLFSVIGHVDQHLRGSMSMPYKLDFLLFGRFPDKINILYQVIGQIKNCKVPIISPVWIIKVVASTVFVTSGVSKPHVVPLIDKLNYGRKFFSNDPAVGRCKKSMLKVHYFCIGLCMMSSDPKKRLGMSISRFRWVTLVVHTLFFDHLLKVSVIVFILAGFVNVNASVDLVEKWRLSWIKLGIINEALL